MIMGRDAIVDIGRIGQVITDGFFFGNRNFILLHQSLQNIFDGSGRFIKGFCIEVVKDRSNANRGGCLCNATTHGACSANTKDFRHRCYLKRSTIAGARQMR